ncbi:hypothetical protein CK203_064453 [Vitis vinifera]|uniref:Uncharacterized protein n=1 Tax=Vitis vinifera TaxID=29760 RepID=A0A438GAF4_VITVI|nr:hypothetical protein CK203_064453 [Vitis vinifera]
MGEEAKEQAPAEVKPEAEEKKEEKARRRKKKNQKRVKEVMIDMAQNQVSGLTTMELNVNMHCEACAAQLPIATAKTDQD